MRKENEERFGTMTEKDLAETVKHTDIDAFAMEVNTEGLTWAAYMEMTPMERAHYGPWKNPRKQPPSAKESMATKSGAMREKKDAIPYDLVPFIEITEAFARVAEFGAVKYEPWNWTKGLSRVQLLCSLLRHTFAYLRGRDKDAETGLNHADHILWNAAALVHNVHWGLEDGRRAEPPRDYNLAENNPVDKG